MLIGVKAKLESDLVENSTGTINIKGQEWLCVGDNGFVGSSGERVEVVKLQDGCVVVKGVKKYKKKKTKNKSM